MINKKQFLFQSTKKQIHVLIRRERVLWSTFFRAKNKLVFIKTLFPIRQCFWEILVICRMCCRKGWKTDRIVQRDFVYPQRFWLVWSPIYSSMSLIIDFIGPGLEMEAGTRLLHKLLYFTDRFMLAPTQQ